MGGFARVARDGGSGVALIAEFRRWRWRTGGNAGKSFAKSGEDVGVVTAQ